ncbi:Uncharacterised protein [Vibrio cholerae]|nr:Uncharacterised protein [Vibrio cholerae]
MLALRQPSLQHAQFRLAVQLGRRELIDRRFQHFEFALVKHFPTILAQNARQQLSVLC